LAAVDVDRTTTSKEGKPMNHKDNFAVELDQTDENFFYEVSDETLEAAAGIEGQSLVTIGPTIMVGGCC
jgi:hypothetical protein